MKNGIWYSILKITIPIILLSSCVKGDSIQPPPVESPLFTSPADFNYETSKDALLDFKLLNNNNEPIANALINIMDKPHEYGGIVLFSALTDMNGGINTTFKLPTYLKTVSINSNTIGVIYNATVRVENQNITCTLGGKDGYTGNVEAERPKNSVLALAEKNQSLTYKYLGSYNSFGRPNYLVTNNDIINLTLLSYINASLPEQKPVPDYHPVYLSSNVENNINIQQDGDVYITFVHEGASNNNTLAYFIYPTNNKPTNINNIDSLYIVFPNASYTGSGGNMTSGNKVKLGRFKANTSIGFCMIANGWNASTKTVGAGLGKYFSIDALNPEINETKKRHSVLLKDNVHNLYLVGIEDINRENISCDNDFNDLIFYVTATNSSNAISGANVNPIDKPGDADNDGVSNVYDQFPNDPARAYINWYPSSTAYGTVAYEDTWPNTGDYDMNDLVVEYRYKIINNAANKTVELFANYVLKAAGATFKNGFGVQFPFSHSMVSSVIGAKLNNAYPILLNANGTESGQTNAVIIPFNDFFYLMNPSSTNATVNTDPGGSRILPDTIKIKMNFVSPITAETLGTAPFNQFLIATENRSKEVHLPGYKPTNKANTALFNTVKDNTIPSQNRYYKTITNMPFGLGLPQRFDYPIEGKPISSVYLHFAEWAQSGGKDYPDWYIDKPGYRSPNSIYK